MPSGLRTLVVGSALLCAALAAGAIALARFIGHGTQLGAGTAAGSLLGLLGIGAAALCVKLAKNRGGAFWGIWGAGFLGRVLIIAAAGFAFWRIWPSSYAAPMLSMAAAWLTFHFWEIGWLCGRCQETDRG